MLAPMDWNAAAIVDAVQAQLGLELKKMQAIQDVVIIDRINRSASAN